MLRPRLTVRCKRREEAIDMIRQPNLLLITADDMNWDAVGAFGCPVPDTTPNIDGLAAGGMCFDHAHVTIAVCQPSRSAMMTGRYPHRSGGEGFFCLRRKGVPILPALLKDAGYAVGILGKVTHSTPYAAFNWNMAYDMAELGQGRNPDTYYQHTSAFVRQAMADDRPFLLMANSHDPHRPFYGNDKADWYDNRPFPPAVPPSRTFSADEVTVPGCLPELPQVRLEIAEYYNSVRRCDDTVGRILAALRETGAEENTLVIFLSDNGMAFPFAKTNCYLNSTRTPWIVRWPTVMPTGGKRDRTHFVAGIDIMPTCLEAAGVAVPGGVDGCSFLPLLRGETQTGREFVFTQFHQTAGRNNYPMRCVQTRRFGYIYNPWSDGARVFKNESQAGRSFAAMRDAVESDADIAARVDLFLHRVPEELYDFDNDPDALNNVVDDPRFAGELDALRDRLEEWMVQADDPALAAFRRRRDDAARHDLLHEMSARMGGR